MTDQPLADVDALAYEIAQHSLEAEFPKYKDDPAIYRSACEGMIANLCKARGVKARNIVIKIQNTAWNTASKAGTVADPRELLRIARDEISAMREMNKADDKHLLDKTNAKKRLGVETMPREKQAPLETPGHVTGGLFGNKPAEPAPEEMSDDINVVIPRDTPPASAPAADKAPARLNTWSGIPAALKAYQDRIEYMAYEAGVDMKDARAWGLNILGVADETQIPMTVPEALNKVRRDGMSPSIEDNIDSAHEEEARIMQALKPTRPEPDTAPDNKPDAPPVEITQKKASEPIVSTSSEASVIIFACEQNKASHIITLANGQKQAVSITIRQGVDASEIETAIKQYQQLVTIPGVEAHQVISAQPAVATTTIPGSTPRPAAPVAPATVASNGDEKAPKRTGDTVSFRVVGIARSFNPKTGQPQYGLYQNFGAKGIGKDPSHTVKSTNEKEMAALRQFVDTETIAQEIQPCNFTCTYTRGDEFDKGKFWHDNVILSQ